MNTVTAKEMRGHLEAREIAESLLGVNGKSDLIYTNLLNSLDDSRQRGEYSPGRKSGIVGVSARYEDGNVVFRLSTSVKTRRPFSLFRKKPLIDVADEIKNIVLLFEKPMREIFPEVEVSNHHIKPTYSCLDIDYAVQGENSPSYRVEIIPGDRDEILGEFLNYQVDFVSQHNVDRAENASLLHKIMTSGNAKLTLEARLDYCGFRKRGNRQ